VLRQMGLATSSSRARVALVPGGRCATVVRFQVVRNRFVARNSPSSVPDFVIG